MKPALRLIALLWLIAPCAPTAAAQFDIVRPLPRDIVGQMRVDAVDVTASAQAEAAMTAYDAKAAAKPQPASSARPVQADYAALPFTRMVPLVMEDVTRAWGLTSGRPVRLAVTVVEFATANAARAMLGGSRDIMAGLVEVQDAHDRRMLGLFTVKVVNRHMGWSGMLIRGGGIRERLAEEFALETSRVLSGRRSIKPTRQTGRSPDS